MLTVREAAKQMGLQPPTIRLWMAQRKLAYVKLGRAVRVPEEEVQRLIREGTIPSRSEQVKRRPRVK